jgi:small redox-active disulfide protein 2
MKIQILGTGCKKCRKLAENAEAAAQELQLDYELVKVTEMKDIAGFGILMTPALAIDGQVKLSGKAPSVKELKGLLSV